MKSWPHSTRSRRPGTPGAAATPATADARLTPASTRATIAPSALETLNGPGSATDASASTPPGPMTRKVLPSAPPRTSAARQSAPRSPSAEMVVTGIWARAASVRPHSSSVLTTPARANPGVNRLALTAKYSSMLAWKSRWSWERLVNTTTS